MKKSVSEAISDFANLNGLSYSTSVNNDDCKITLGIGEYLISKTISLSEALYARIDTVTPTLDGMLVELKSVTA